MPDTKEVILQKCKNAIDCGKPIMDYSFYYRVIELLKEQEAVEPVLEQDSMVCGVCGHEVIWQKWLNGNVWLDEQLDYCPHCGKAVNWE